MKPYMGRGLRVPIGVLNIRRSYDLRVLFRVPCFVNPHIRELNPKANDPKLEVQNPACLGDLDPEAPHPCFGRHLAVLCLSPQGFRV